MDERVAVLGLEIPEIGCFLLVYQESLACSKGIEEFLAKVNDIRSTCQSFLRKLFDNDKIVINFRPNGLLPYKEITIKNVWVADHELRPYTYKWSRKGLAVLEWSWKSEQEKAQTRETFEKLFKS